MSGEMYRLPNGAILTPGGRIRVPAEDIWKIPEHDIVRMGLRLDAAAASPASEVIYWPLSAGDS